MPSQGKLGPYPLAPASGALAAPACAEGGHYGQPAPALVVSVGLSGFQVKRTLVPCLDHE